MSLSNCLFLIGCILFTLGYGSFILGGVRNSGGKDVPDKIFDFSVILGCIGVAFAIISLFVHI